jgi:hypothetical protein
VSAVISGCGLYRYELRRTWDEQLPALVYVMLNPSTADAEADDPTIRKCVGFAKRMGYGGIVVVNLYAFRATDPRDLIDSREAGVAIIGPENDRRILDAMYAASAVVFAWGATQTGRPSDIAERVATVRGLAAVAHCKPLCLARSKHGDPRHPLMLGYAATPEPWCAP